MEKDTSKSYIEYLGLVWGVLFIPFFIAHSIYYVYNRNSNWKRSFWDLNYMLGLVYIYFSLCLAGLTILIHGSVILIYLFNSLF